MSLVGLPFQRTHSLALLGRSPLNGGALKSALGFVVGVWVLMPVCGALVGQVALALEHENVRRVGVA